MLTRIISVACLVVGCAVFVGCAEKDYKVHQETQEQTESGPQDVSPGEMVVE